MAGPSPGPSQSFLVNSFHNRPIRYSEHKLPAAVKPMEFVIRPGAAGLIRELTKDPCWLKHDSGLGAYYWLLMRYGDKRRL